MLGFIGRFTVDFEISDYWGIGKSVSRGFGTIKKVGREKQEVRSGAEDRTQKTEKRRTVKRR